MRALIVAALLASSATAIPVNRLGDLIGNRIAGAPVDCIDATQIDQVNIVAGVGVVYSMRSGRLRYLNRPTSGLALLHDGVVLRVDNAGTRLCSAYLVRVVNPDSRAPAGALSLGAFVPYVRP